MLASQAIVVATAWAPPSVPRLSEVTPDGSVTLFVVGITLVVTLLLTIAPLGVVSVVSKAGGGETLRPASRGAIGDRWNLRIRNAMVVAEISAALVLLLATTVLLQNLRRLQDLDPGFRPHGVFQARVSIPTAYRSPEDLAHFFEQVAGRLATSPGVKNWGVISIAPLTGLLATVPFTVAGQPDAEGARPSANLREISPGYLDTVGTRLLQGRAFAETDQPNTVPVALVSAALADRFLAGHAVGRQLLVDDNNQGPRPVEIVGIVENVRQAALDLPPALDIYLPLRQVHPDGVPLVRNNQFWMVKTDGDPAAFRATFLAHLKSVDPDAAVSGTGAMSRFIDDWLGPRRFNLGLFGAFALTTVLLAVLGLYGLVSYTVSQRVPEIGLRMAIGATHGDVQRMILGQAGVLAVIGVILGIAGAIAGRAYIARFVSDVRISPAATAFAAAMLVAVVLAAAWVPARRAARIEPTLALRGQ
jgi:putative ABC transport system permease protein